MPGFEVLSTFVRCQVSLAEQFTTWYNGVGSIPFTGVKRMINQRAQAAFKRGQEWEERGDNAKAINAYREAIAIEPDWVVPFQCLGTLYLEMGRYDEAAVAYRQAKLVAIPGDGSIEDMLSVIERIQTGVLDPTAYRYYLMARDLPDEQVDEKIRLCQLALGLNPNYAAPYATLGKMLLATGQPNQARAVLERGLACQPNAFIRALLTFNLGTVLLASGQRDPALTCFRQVVDLNANLSVTHFATLQLEAASVGRI
jgi:superkiller protein 3